MHGIPEVSNDKPLTNEMVGKDRQLACMQSGNNTPFCKTISIHE